MSPLPANELRVVLSAGQVLAARPGWSWSGGRLRRCLRAPVRVAVGRGETGDAGWRPALAALDPLLREQAPGTRVHVTLSNAMVRYALVPPQPRLGGEAHDAYVRDCFAQLYGEAAEHWNLRAAPGATMVASAIDAGLAGELAAACAQAGVTLASLQPLFAAVVNRWRARMRARCFWLVLAEPGTLCVALAERRQWRVVFTARAGDEWLAGLAPLLRRETLLSGARSDVEKLFLWAPELAADASTGHIPWPVARLLAAAPDGAPSSDATWFGVGR